MREREHDHTPPSRAQPHEIRTPTSGRCVLRAASVPRRPLREPALATADRCRSAACGPRHRAERRKRRSRSHQGHTLRHASVRENARAAAAACATAPRDARTVRHQHHGAGVGRPSRRLPIVARTTHRRLLTPMYPLSVDAQWGRAPASDAAAPQAAAAMPPGPPRVHASHRRRHGGEPPTRCPLAAVADVRARSTRDAERIFVAC
jgi:hypothetical protein